LRGKDKDKRGKVLKVLSGGTFVVVEKLNIKKKHRRAGKNFQGGIIEIPAPIPEAKLMLVCPRCGKPSRVRSKSVAGEKKARVCVRCNEIMDKV